jgi:predicted ATP-grasp superfamily ATP-dependent carboligase
MFIEAYHLAASSTEKIAATRELGKLHGIYPDPKPAAVQINVSENALVETNIKQLKQLSDLELAALAGPEMLLLLHS